MSIVPIITFIEIYDPKNVPSSGDIAGAIEHRFQNSEPSLSGIQWSGPDPVHTTNNKFSFLAFIYQGATRTKDGSNLESALVLANESNENAGNDDTTDTSSGENKEDVVDADFEEVKDNEEKKDAS